MGQQEDEDESNLNLEIDRLANELEFQSISNNHPSVPTREYSPDLLWCSISKRLTVALLACLGFVISFGIRCNFGAAVARMLRVHDAAGEAKFDWSRDQVITIDSSFFYGFMVTPVLGGYLATKYPANIIFGIGIAATAALNLFVPMSAHLGYQILIVVRFTQGMFEGVTLPACYGLLRWWTPTLECTRLATIVLTGSYAGLIIGVPLSDTLVQYFGWHSPFYLYGILGILWYITWLWAIYEKPSKHPTIRPEEREYIEKSMRASTISTTCSKSIPWKHIFTSMPVLAICIANACKSWTFYVVTVSHYYFNTFNEVTTTVRLSMLLLMVIVPLGGILADCLRRRTRLTTTTVRKVFNFGGFVVEAGVLLLFGTLADYDKWVAVVGIISAVGFSGFAISAFNVNHLDIAPRYAGILMGISSCAGILFGFLCQIVVEKMTKNAIIGEWEMVCIVAAVVNLFGVAFYTVFASGEVQSWAEPEDPPPPDYSENLVLQQHNHPNPNSNDTL